MVEPKDWLYRIITNTVSHPWVNKSTIHAAKYSSTMVDVCVCVDFQIFQSLPTLAMIIANLRYPAKNDKFFAGECRYSH